MIKRILCKHSWKHVSSMIFHKEIYGCTKCGKTKALYPYDVNVWKFRRALKGDSFE